jgi:glycosyltransferase involved in cell wall biosynthesis
LYDSLIITNLPAFYKINLFNEVAKKSKIFVIFISSSSKIRTSDFTVGAIEFEHIFLSGGEFERLSVARLFKLAKIIMRTKHKKLLICGWDMLEYWVCALLSPRSKNIAVVESSEHEGAKGGPKLWLKKLFVSRISKAIVSGKSQENLMRNLGFEGECVHSGGVGIFYKPKLLRKERKFGGNFLFVGRLSPEKNIEFLLDIFARLPDFRLTIAGSGPIKGKLREKATQNITFAGHIPNDEIGALYNGHDVLLLPSLIEPWGLVVEEAIYHGMPVIISDRVGCANEMVLTPNTGFVLPIEQNIWYESIKKLQNSDVYKKLSTNCYDFDFEERDRSQIKAFID